MLVAIILLYVLSIDLNNENHFFSGLDLMWGYRGFLSIKILRIR